MHNHIVNYLKFHGPEYKVYWAGVIKEVSAHEKELALLGGKWARARRPEKV